MHPKSSSPSLAVDELFNLLECWRQLTLAEHEAISSKQWQGLLKIQSEKRSLQTAIKTKRQAALASLSGNLNSLNSLKRQLEKWSGNLTALEKKNHDLLAVEIAATKSKLHLQNNSLRNLKGVQKAYGGSSRSFWHSYS